MQTQSKRIFGQPLPLALDLAWLYSQHPERTDKGSAGQPTKRVDKVQPISPYKGRKHIVKRELIEQGLIYGLGFVFVVAALPLLRYAG